MRSRLALLFALACATPLLAQSRPDATTHAPNAVAETFLHFGPPYGGWLLMALDSIPAEKYGFSPTSAQQSIGFIAQHLEGSTDSLCATIGSVPYRRSARDSVAPSVRARWPKDTLIARVRSSLLSCAATIEKLTDAQLADEISIPTPNGPATVVRARYLMLLITDLAEHYSQIAGYMRLLGMTPPSALPRR